MQIVFGSIPSKSNQYIIAGNRLIKSAKVKQYEESFAIQCKFYRNANIDTAFEIEVDAYLANPRQDLDGIMKILMDSLQSVKAISNDNLAYKITARKFIDKVSPRVEFQIKQI
jgi:Holliday junction resolvase RusA-like endonuclease